MESTDGPDVAVVLRGMLAARRLECVEESSTLQGLGLDSADVLELVADLEDHFGVAIPLNELSAVRTFGQLVGHVQRRLAR